MTPKGAEFLGFNTSGLPKWNVKCDKCGKAAATGCWKCVNHLTGGKGKIPGHVAAAARKRYVAWLVTGTPDHRLADVAEEALFEHVMENSTMTDEQMVRLAIALAESAVTAV